MNKFYSKIATVVLGFTMAIGIGAVAMTSGRNAAKVSAAVTYDLVTNVSNLASGDSIIIGGGTSGTVKFLSTTQTNNNRSATSGSQVTNGSVTLPDDAEVITLGASSSNWTLHANGTTSGYLYASSSSSNQLKTRANDSDGNSRWAISITNAGVASITAMGSNTRNKLKFNSSSSLFACYSDGQTAVAIYKRAATVAVTGVTVSPTNVSLGVGGTQQLTPTVSPNNATNKAVTYTSNATGVATVSETGLITAVAAGNATITVKTVDGNKTATCAVTVTAPIAVTGVTLNKNSTSIEIGSAETLVATVSPANASNKSVTWTSSNTSVATVANGTVTAVGKGNSTITATTVNGGFIATCTVTVTTPSKVTFTAGTDTGSATDQNTSGTLNKSGISFYCSGWKNDSGNYRLYKDKTVTFTSTIGNMAKIEFTGTESSYKISQMGSATAGNLVTDDTNNKATWTGSTTTVSFIMTAQGRASQVVVTIESTDPVVELAPSSATSVKMMKGDTDTSVKVLVKNIDNPSWTFTFDEDEEEDLTTSSYINVTQSALVNNVSTLTITTKATGSTTLKISVSGTACAQTVDVTVNPKPVPGTMVAKLNDVVVSGPVECQVSAYKQFTFAAEDTDGNPYSIVANGVTGEKLSGDATVTISGTRVTCNTSGTATVRYSLKVLSTVYVDIVINAIEDYNETVDSITFNSNLSANQGDPVDVSAVFATKTATTHFGNSAEISNDQLSFSYTNNRNDAATLAMFSYDFDHGTTVDQTHKNQQIFVFTTFDENYSGSFNITITQANNPLTAITLTNPEIENDEVTIDRGDSLQLTWALTPENPTDGRELQFSVDESDDGVNISVNSNGLISVAADSGLGVAVILVEAVHNTSIATSLLVNVGLESMSYIISLEEEWTLVSDPSTLAVGDQVILTGVKNDTTYAATTYPGSGNNVQADTENTLTVSDNKVTGVVSTMIYTLEAGTAEGSVAFKDSSNKYLYAAGSTGNNYLKTRNDINGDASFILNADGTVVAQGDSTRNYMRYNNSSTSNLFSCYASSSTTGNLVTFYKKSGGDTPHNVDETLFNAIHNNFGTGKTYAWDASCSSFNMSKWVLAGSKVKSIANFANYQLDIAVGDINGNEIEQFLAKYDVVVNKFYKNCSTNEERAAFDFLGRVSSGKVIPAQANNILGTETYSNSTITLIVILSMVSLIAVGGYLTIKRRKVQ